MYLFQELHQYIYLQSTQAVDVTVAALQIRFAIVQENVYTLVKLKMVVLQMKTPPKSAKQKNLVPDPQEGVRPSLHQCPVSSQ